jgi:regulatory protein
VTVDPDRAGDFAGRDVDPAVEPALDREAGPDADPESVARSICLRQLTLGPRSRGQLAEALRRRGVPDDAGERVLDRLTEVGLVDDAAFASTLVRSRVAAKGLARRALAAELRAKGVDDETAAEALETLDPDEERATARALVERRVAATRGLSYDARVRRLAGMLARKGYPAGVAFAVVRDALVDDGSSEDGSSDDGWTTA